MIWWMVDAQIDVETIPLDQETFFRLAMLIPALDKPSKGYWTHYSAWSKFTAIEMVAPEFQ